MKLFKIQHSLILFLSLVTSILAKIVVEYWLKMGLVINLETMACHLT